MVIYFNILKDKIYVEKVKKKKLEYVVAQFSWYSWVSFSHEFLSSKTTKEKSLFSY